MNPYNYTTYPSPPFDCIISGVTSIMHGAGLQILSGERQKQLQESIIAAETAGVLLDEETDQIRQKVSGLLCNYTL